ncbi:PREDICTED: uncharacterized protein LOC108974861 [Bactrocera latifrons]|uniref:uncharacterized protein LOC108974861 n=1 Tax=Bactrocera latifrons TaxID=174628 RepID=UPI0008DDF770|nr:PREDICTED: uncharacterized protein LOC108974861 [Bactrocera latifrons]
MDDEKLIDLVETRSELFNKSSPYYKLQSRKDTLWAEIERELKASGEMYRHRWLTLRDRYRREVRKANAPSGSEKEFPMKFLKPHILPRPQLQSPAEETQLQPQGQALEVEVPSPLWSSLSSITISLPSPSLPFPVAQSVLSPTPSSTSTSLPSPSCSRQVAIKKGRKRGSSVSTINEVDQKMIEAIELFKNKCSSTQTTQQTQQKQTANPAAGVQHLTTILNKIIDYLASLVFSCERDPHGLSGALCVLAPSEQARRGTLGSWDD